MKPSDVLNKAAEVLMERGHCKEALSDASGRVCLMGALVATVSNADDAFQGARGYLRATIGDGIGWRIVTWNDRPETTEAMAIGALHDAAILAKEAGE